MKIKINLIAVGLLALMASCAITDVDRTADFSQYRTFSWGKATSNVSDPVYESTLIEKNIRRTIESEFAKRGIVEAGADADFVVSYKTQTAEKQQWRSSPYNMAGPFFYPMSRYYYWGGFGYPYSWNYGPQQTTFTEGTLMIDVIDSKSNDLVWRGTVKGNVDNVATLEKQVAKAVKAIMKKYPGHPAPSNANAKVIS